MRAHASLTTTTMTRGVIIYIRRTLEQRINFASNTVAEIIDVSARGKFRKAAAVFTEDERHALRNTRTQDE